jgi:broad specificity phosphatase PhoE
MEHNIKPCLVIWVRHGQRADHVAEEGKEESKSDEFQADSPLTELGI